MSLVAESAGTAGRSVLHALQAPVRMARGVAAAQGDLQSLGLDPEAARAITARRQEVSLQNPDVTAESFGLAAYDIQSGIENLTTEGIADLTEASAVMARATKSEVTDMTDLMKTLHSAFRGALHSELSDTEFGWAAAGQLSAAVKEFKTEGSKMQQAIKSAGSQMALQGVSVAEQLAAVGAAQVKMSPERAGTALRAFAKTAVKAEDAFANSERSVRLTGDDGNLLPLTQAMENLRQEFGQEITGRRLAEMSKALGSEEAAELIAALWAQSERHERGVAALAAAADPLGGERLARAMQAARNDNADARLTEFARGTARLSLELPEGDSRLVADSRVRLSGWRDGVPADWRVTRAAHLIDERGYGCQLTAELADA